MSERPSSFMRRVFEGVIQDDLLVPFPDTPGQREALSHLESRVRDVGRSSLQSKAIDQDGGISAEVRASLAGAGALGVTLPKEHGGAGLSLPASVAYYETVGGLAGRSWPGTKPSRELVEERAVLHSGVGDGVAQDHGFRLVVGSR